jgi:hypothetical protein
LLATVSAPLTVKSSNAIEGTVSVPALSKDKLAFVLALPRVKVPFVIVHDPPSSPSGAPTCPPLR